MIVYQNVLELTNIIKNTLEKHDQLTFFQVSGEISNYKHHSSNHRYFTLKDKNAQISVVMFATYASKMTFVPKNGDFVTITGHISVYEPSGSYSIRALKLEKVGQGALYEQFLKLKADLEKLGYFDQSIKKPIPKYPTAIGIVTSKTGAVLQDVKQTLEMRYKLAPLYLYQALVQGSESSKSIAEQINKANEQGIVDVLIVGRGGGSIEDLWAFNEMPVIEAILNSKIPIITAIGHETDTTISDYVSDARAATPTQAAVIASPNMIDVSNDINVYQKQLVTNYRRTLDNKSMQVLHLTQTLNHLSPFNKLATDLAKINQLSQLLTKNYKLLLVKMENDTSILKSRLMSPTDILRKHDLSISDYKNKLNFNINNIVSQRKQALIKSSYELTPRFTNVINNKKETLITLIQTLKNLNPLSKLEAGFGLLSKDDQIIKSIKMVNIGDVISIKLTDGTIKTQVIDKKDGN